MTKLPELERTTGLPPTDPAAGAVRYVLVLSGAGPLQRFVLEAGALHVLGRSPASDIWLDDPSVSRRHAVVLGSTPPQIEDLDSRNGTKIDGQPILPRTLTPIDVGSVVELGELRVRLEMTGRTGDDVGTAYATLQPPSYHATMPPPTLQAVTPPPSTVAMESPQRLGGAPRGAHERADVNDLVVADPRSHRLFEQALVMARSNLTVLIVGETGVGKERLAQTLVAESHRATQVFTAINCAALPESIAESELFGYERGAFTGAQIAKPGLISASDGGTLFLDEIGELSLAVQAKLLRVLETQELLPLGAVKPKRVDVRFIAATNRDLKAEILMGRFRSDLYFRINRLVLHVPPLRERPGEILPLADRFAARFAAGLGKPLPRFSKAACDAMLAYGWPGNVRELRNIVERAVLLCARPEIDADDIPHPEGAFSEGETVTAVTSVVERRSSRPVAGRRQVLTPDAIRTALARAAGDQAEAAKLLGISRRTLINWLDKYSLPRPRKRPST